MTGDEIWKRLGEMDMERRLFMQSAMEPFDAGQREERKQLRDACGKIGHKFKFTNLGPVGNPWFHCMRCGISKVEEA